MLLGIMIGNPIYELILPSITMILGIVLLVIGSNWLVEGSAQLAYRLSIPKIIIGATVVSLGTTSPEAAVSVLAAIKGLSGISLGNAIGSVICDTGLIFGLGTIIGKLPIDRFILNRQGLVQLGSALLLAIFAYSSTYIFGLPVIPRPVGIVFLVLLACYMMVSIRWAKTHPKLANILEEEAEISSSNLPVWACVALVVAGLAIVIKSSDWVIEEGKHICLVLGIPESVIAVTGIALGTSLPELATGLTSIKQGHPEILIGNVVGADILNILFVVGASATAIALPIPKEVLTIHIPTMIVVLITFRILILLNKKSFIRISGIPLLLIYITFLYLVFRYKF